MKIAFDIDGTLTDFEKFIINNKKYLQKKYNLLLTNYNGYDVDQMFEIKDNFLKKGYSISEATQKSEEILNNFWYKYYFKYCVMTKFRKGVKEKINELVKEGHTISIISSRKKTCEKTFLGRLVKFSTILKFKINGINYTDITFLPSDEEKIEYIKKNDFHLLVDDKPFVIHEISKFLNCICINSGYNEEQFNQNVTRVSSFEANDILDIVHELNKDKENQFNGNSKINERYKKKGISKVHIYHSLNFTERCYKIIKAIGSPVIIKMYNPIVLNKENISEQKPIIYAPNHRKTLDPFFIVLSSDDAIHWAALKRFFTAEDSIFNNSKNPFLCHLTSTIFKTIGAVPVDRGGDTSETISEINYYLNQGSCVGIFPEGTTNKNPNDAELLKMKTGILHFAQKNHVLIQPISIVWFPKNISIKNRIIVNYQKPFSMENLTIEEGIEKWNDAVLEGINQNNRIINSMIETVNSIGDKALKLEFKKK